MNRGHNRDQIFDDDLDRNVFLGAIRRAAERYELEVNGFVLMTNHFHLIVTPRTTSSVRAALAHFQQRYSTYYNQKHERMGTVWNGRYLPVALETSWHWLTCLRYVELNPVRAKMVSDPAEYSWSSYGVHAHGSSAHSWLTCHSVLESLAPSENDRQAIYRTLCKSSLSDSELALIRNGAWVKLIKK